MRFCCAGQLHNRAALELISTGAVQVEDLITHRLPLDEVRRAIDTVTSGEGLKVVIEPSSSPRS